MTLYTQLLKNSNSSYTEIVIICHPSQSASLKKNKSLFVLKVAQSVLYIKQNI